MIDKEDAKAELYEVLAEVAQSVQARAYAPYSNYKVGAAIVTAKGTVFAGCNVENASYGATICAERSAILQMVAAGEDTPIACVIYTEGEEPAPPCGMCRQVLAEFAEDMSILLLATHGDDQVAEEHSLADLLPGAFDAAFFARAKASKAKVRSATATSDGERPRSRAGVRKKVKASPAAEGRSPQPRKPAKGDKTRAKAPAPHTRSRGKSAPSKAKR